MSAILCEYCKKKCYTERAYADHLIKWHWNQAVKYMLAGFEYLRVQAELAKELE